MRQTATAALLDTFRPSLIPLEENLTAALFPLMKIIPAASCVRQAMQEGLLERGAEVVESSSGTMALGLALVCNWLGFRLTIVTDYACDDALRRRLEDLGAKVDRVAQPAASGGYQRARLDRLHEILQTIPGSWWVNQYGNPANPGAYSEFISQLIQTLGRVDILVGTVGSGGSLCGSSAYLRALFPEARTIGVDTFGSVLFGLPDGPRRLRGLGNSLMPPNLDHTLIDEVHWVSAAEAYTATRVLHRATGLFRGGTTGAAWMVARYLAAREPQARVVFLSPDDGNRYADSIYNDSYLMDNSLLLDELPAEPVRVAHPEEASSHWSVLDWQRRPLTEWTNNLTVEVAV